MNSYYFVLHRVDDGNVAAQSRDENSICRRNKQTPEWPLRQPDATHELIKDAVMRQAGHIHLDNLGHHHEERRTHVCDALVHDQNVHRLYKILACMIIIKLPTPILSVGEGIIRCSSLSVCLCAVCLSGCLSGV